MLVWSDSLHLVVLLENYVTPKPAVAGYVRRQLLQDEETVKILQALKNERREKSRDDSVYGALLWFSGLEIDARLDLNGDAESNPFVCALFDLTLGQRVRSFQLSCYSEFHSARAAVESFFHRWDRLMSPGDVVWWDGVYGHRPDPQDWISARLGRSSVFLAIFESWIADSQSLQTWLESFEATTPVVNNPDGESRVFSEEAAIQILRFAKVQCLHMSWLRLKRLTLLPTVSRKPPRPEAVEEVRISPAPAPQRVL